MQIDPRSHIAKDARILIIDDEQMNVSVLGQLLSRAGYAICISITDPRQAVAQFLAMQPDLLLLDWHMDAMSGLHVLEELKRQVPDDELPPILVVTGDCAPETKRDALNAGATDFLAKPLDYTEVLLRIRNLLQLRMVHLHSQAINRGLEEEVRKRTAALEKKIDQLKQALRNRPVPRPRPSRRSPVEPARPIRHSVATRKSSSSR